MVEIPFFFPLAFSYLSFYRSRLRLAGKQGRVNKEAWRKLDARRGTEKILMRC